jgi:predicted nucleic acid-binding protein
VTTYVLDASVAMKWALPGIPEPLTDKAVDLLKRYRESEVDFVVPDVFWAEIANALWKGVRQQRWDRDQAEMAAADMRDRDFQTVSSQILMTSALKIALKYDRNIYDCLYAALAEESRADLITADERLFNALASRFPMKWLGSL